MNGKRPRRLLVRQTFPGLEQPQISRQVLNINVLDKLLAAYEIIVTEQLPLAGPSRSLLLPVRLQGAAQASNGLVLLIGTFITEITLA